MINCEKTQCSHCAHMSVCSKKDIFLGLYKLVSNSSVCETFNGESIKLRDIDWVNIAFTCTHFLAMSTNVRCSDPGEYFEQKGK